jgi:hypothetical protein
VYKTFNFKSLKEKVWIEYLSNTEFLSWLFSPMMFGSHDIVGKWLKVMINTNENPTLNSISYLS